MGVTQPSSTPPALGDMLCMQSGCGVDEYFDGSFGSQDG
jgi:hypothetical protein